MNNPEVDATLSRLRSECELCGAWSPFTGRTEKRGGTTYVVVRCPNGHGEFTSWKPANDALVAAYEAAARDRASVDAAVGVLTGRDRVESAALLEAAPAQLPLFSIEDVALPRESAVRWCERLLESPGWAPVPSRRLRVEEALATAVKYDDQACLDRVVARATPDEIAGARAAVERRFPQGRFAIRLRRWAENVARMRTVTRAELVAAIDGHDEGKLPEGVTWLEIDDREMGLGGVWLRFAADAITRSQFEMVFGRGEALARVPLDGPAKFMTTVDVAGAPMRCTVIAEYRGDLDNVPLQGLYLRTDRARG